MRNLFIPFFSLLLLGISGLVQAQCDEQRHSTNWHDGWSSCEVAVNPNAARQASHWIMYDLKEVHELNRTYVWNYNDINNLNNGIQEVAIDYSIDGTNWTTSGIYTFGQADGTPTYGGEDGPNLGGIEARYVLLTAITNYGGDCYALSEIRIEAEELISSAQETEQTFNCLKADIFPNPAKFETRVYVESDCKGEVLFQLFNTLGKSVAGGNITNAIEQGEYFDLPTESLQAGEYILKIQNEEGVVEKTLVKL